MLDFLRPIFVCSAIAILLAVAACSKPESNDTSSSELEQIKQELTELKKEIAEKEESVTISVI